MTPSVALRPTIPQRAAEIRIEPPPSVPSASGPMPEATATAAPPLEAPQVTLGSIGLSVRPKIGASVDCLWPNSGVVVWRRARADRPLQEHDTGAPHGET